MNILVDWLTVSIKAMTFENLVSILKLPVDECRLIGSRWLEKCMCFGGIEVHFGDYLILNMSGSGCRLLESLYDMKLNWIDFIEQFLSLEGTHMSRLDVACDDYPQNGEKGILSYNTMLRHRIQKRYISLSQKSTWTGGDKRILNFGSEKSERLLRIYDKALERGIEGHWIRAEFQLRNDAALSFFMRALECGSIGQAYQGMLFDYLRFTREVNDSNHTERLTVTRWWKTFCGNAGRIKGFYIGGLEYNLESLERYLNDQTASSMKTYLAVNGGDVTKLVGMAQGATYNKKQEFLLKTQPLIDKMYEDYGKQEERNKKLAEIVGSEPRRVSHKEMLTLALAQSEQNQNERLCKERFMNWDKSMSFNAANAAWEKHLKEVEELAAKDLPFD